MWGKLSSLQVADFQLPGLGRLETVPNQGGDKNVCSHATAAAASSLANSEFRFKSPFCDSPNTSLG
jgi:hypothetical protein